MVQKNLVYHKSVKGTEAIATRQHGLGPKLRSMLILIDGKRGFDELARLSQMLGDTEELLGQLLDQGFIEPVAAPAGPAAAPHAERTTAPAPLAAAAAPISLKEAQRFVSRRLTDLLGPNAEELCLKIEATRTVKDFQSAVARAEGILRQYKNAQAAAEFAAEVQAHMPAG
ncbi:MAG: hypothetical protein Q8R33_24220 [Burkholderiales bacterium]|nr:hypothetical protein [Burkholderiales bacterium]